MTNDTTTAPPAAATNKHQHKTHLLSQTVHLSPHTVTHNTANRITPQTSTAPPPPRHSAPSPHLLAGGDLRLGGAADLLHAVLALLPQLPAAGWFAEQAVPHQAVFRLELLGEVERVVDEGEAGGPAAAKVVPGTGRGEGR